MMNTTNTHEDLIDDSNPIFIYCMIGIEVLNALVAIWTSWKLGHLNLIIQHVKCGCIEFDDIHLEVSDSEDKTR